MTVYIPPNEYEVAYGHSQIGVTQPAICTIGMRYDGDDFISEHPFVALAWATHIMPLICADITLTSTKFSSNEGTVTSLALATPGGSPEKCATYNVAYLVHKNNLTVGRRGRGRMFVPGVSEDAVNPAGVVLPSGVTAWNNALKAYYDACVAVNFQPVLFHSPEVGDPTPFSSFVTALTLDSRAATQRKRLRR